MSNESRLESATLDLFRHLKSKKEALQARHAAELAEIDNQIEAVNITLRLLREQQNAESIEELKPAAIPNNLLGKTAREACIEIAKNNGGLVRVADAKDALVAARILKPSKNTWAIVYTTLQRSKEFEKAAGSGVFRLIESVPLKDRQQANLLQ